MEVHPLKAILDLYIAEFDSLKENNVELSNLQFHRNYGLTLSIPPNWPLLQIINDIYVQNSSLKGVVIYSSTKSYQEFYNKFGDNIDYFSWHEVFTGMQVVNTDVRYAQRIKIILSQAGLVFFLDPPSSLQDIVNQVRGYTEKCLIVIGRGTEKEV